MSSVPSHVSRLGKTPFLGNAVSVLGFPVTVGASCESVAEALFLATSSESQAPPEVPLAWHVVTANPEVLMQGYRHPKHYGTCLQQADIILPDGIGVVYALKHQGVSQATRLPGIELASALLCLAETHEKPVALWGGEPELYPLLVETLRKQYPRLILTFAHHGFVAFGSPEADALAQQCAETQPWLVLVALGCPRQDEWIQRYRSLFSSRTLLMGVGGSFDVWAGKVQRAPVWVQKCHAEWVWRLASQPWRLKRSLPPLIRFVYHVLCQKMAHPSI
ncbi:MAG: WecB/TagA/CpsF family glycosyltransferase [Vampirovibrionales bacterium]